MNEIIRKLTQEVKQKMSEILAKDETKSLIDATKAASDSGNFEVVISTADVDRQGESINQAGWDLSNYLKNPVVLWGHDYYSLPIGICEDIAIQDGKLVARGRFAPEEANPFAQQVRRLYDAGIVRATSVGLIVIEMEGHIVTKAELLEFSFVPVPANPYALSLSKAKEMGLNLEMIAVKGLKLEVKEEQSGCAACGDPECAVWKMAKEHNAKKAKAEGDECEMEDGSMGEMHPNDAGEMVCMAKAQPKTDDEKLIEDYYSKAEHKEKDAQQIGAILAQLQNIIDNALVTAAKLIIDIVQTEYGQSVAGKEAIAEVIKTNETIKALKAKFGDLEKSLGIFEGEEQPEGGAAPKARSEDAQAVTAAKGLDEFLAVRELVKSISTLANQSLERMNEKMRKDREARKR